MARNDIPVGPIAALIVLAAGAVSVTIPAGGLAVAIADGHVIIPHLLSEGLIAVFIAGGAVVVTAGAIPTVSKISKKRGSAFIAACACFEWFIADSVSDLYLEGHSSLEKNLFKCSATLMFVLASGLWSKASEPSNTSRVRFRCAAIVLFAFPTLLVALKIFLLGRTGFTLQGTKLFVLIAATVLLAAIYIGLSATGAVKDE